MHFFLPHWYFRHSHELLQKLNTYWSNLVYMKCNNIGVTVERFIEKLMTQNHTFNFYERSWDKIVINNFCFNVNFNGKIIVAKILNFFMRDTQWRRSVWGVYQVTAMLLWFIFRDHKNLFDNNLNASFFFSLLTPIKQWCYITLLVSPQYIRWYFQGNLNRFACSMLAFIREDKNSSSAFPKKDLKFTSWIR